MKKLKHNCGKDMKGNEKRGTVKEHKGNKFCDLCGCEDESKFYEVSTDTQ